MNRRLRWPLIWFGIALVPRLAYLVEQGTTSVLFFQPMLDEYELARSARMLLAGEGFGPEPLFKAPLYPILLAGVIALTGDAWFWAIRLLQHLLGAALVAIAFDSARAIAAPGRRGAVAAHLAAFALAFYAPLIRLENRIVVDFLALFLQSAAVWSLLRWRLAPAQKTKSAWIAAAGALAALAFLNRPTILVAIPFVALWIAFVGGVVRPRRRRRALAACALFLAFPILSAVALLARNASAGEAMILPWQGGFNLYEANRHGATGRFLTQSAFADSETGNPTRQLAEAGFRDAIRRGQVPEPPEGEYFGALDAWWKSRALSEIRADPAAWATLMGGKTLDLVSDREIYNFEAFEIHRDLSPLLRHLPLSFGWLWPLALASVALLPLVSRGRRPLVALLWIYGIALGGGIALYYTSGRLRMPLLFPAALLATTSVSLAVEAVRARQTSRCRAAFAFATLLFAAGLVMSWGDWRGVRSESFAHAEFARLSNAAWRAGRHDLALDYADRADAARPGYPPVFHLRSQALYSLERFDEAADAFESATNVIPEDATPAYNLGIVRYYHLDDPAGAIDGFMETLRREPGHHRASWMLALSLVRTGDSEGAASVLVAYDASALGPEAPVELLAAFAALDCATNQPQRLAAIEDIAREGNKSEELKRELELAGCER